MPAFVETGLNFVHVDDVAEGHLAALQRGKIGERYILGGENVPFAQMLADIAAMVGRRAPRCGCRGRDAVRSPASRKLLAGDRTRAVRHIDGLRMARHPCISVQQGRRELGYRARPYRERCWRHRMVHDNGYLPCSARSLSTRPTDSSLADT